MDINWHIASKQFDEWLDLIAKDNRKCIEYGESGNTGGAFSGYRIRAIATHSGYQYAIKYLAPFGREGSGEYFQMTPEDRTQLKIEFGIRLHTYMTKNADLRRRFPQINCRASQLELFIGDLT